MRLLLDTHLAVWWQVASSRVPMAAREAVAEADGPVFISRVSLWELAIKVGHGQLELDLRVFCGQLVTDGFSWLGIEQQHLLAYAKLPAFKDHKDPFDRLLVAQSLSEPLILLTTDGKLERYGSTVRVVA